MSTEDPTDNNADSATAHRPLSVHDDLGCEVAWDAHCQRHQRDQKAAVLAERERCIKIVQDRWNLGEVEIAKRIREGR